MDAHRDGESVRILKHKTSLSWIQKFQSCLLGLDGAICWRTVLVLLAWQLSAGVIFNLFLRPISFLINSGIHASLLIGSITSVIFLLSPLAGFLADTKFGRLRVLLFGTYMMLFSTLVSLALMICFTAASFSYDTVGRLLLAMMVLILVVYCAGFTLFVSNVVQFGTDQLRDAPTKYSVGFICAYVWTDALGAVVAMTTNIPGHEITISSASNLLAADKLRGTLVAVLLVVSLLVTIPVLYLVHKNSKWFLLHHSAHNPYKLVCGVLYFAVLHKKPIRRSAFTFCENDRLSRLDFGKQRYGGPYSTEQVEDVKVMLGMLKVLMALGPAFLLEGAACVSFLKHIRNYPLHYHVSAPLAFMLTEYGMTESLATLLFVPLWQCIARPLLKKYSPNMFKRMGVPVCLYTLSFLIYFCYDILSSNSANDKLGYCYTYCSRNATVLLDFSYVHLSSSYVSVFQQVVYSLSHSLLYISAYEFLCSQSPQYMKGLLFGLFYAARTFYQYLAVVSVWSFSTKWRSATISCCSGYSLLNIGIGAITLMLFSIAARKYKYRKRDDICNIYKFAEDYYSNIQ